MLVYDIQAGDVLVDCGVYAPRGDEPRDILEKDCKDSRGDTDLESLVGANSGISNDIELGRFVGLSPNVAEVGENAAAA